ncbi:MAG: hypothetical protein HYR76_11645 [Ignavibacteria bacterium]|nr:hypothetical protein [Ignavibacteria bacterium]
MLLHLLGFGLLMTTLVAGVLLEIQYRKAKDLQAKAIILRPLRSIGLLSPIASLLLLVTGIGNMVVRQYTLFAPGWLTAKIIFYAFAVISGVIFGVKSRKRGALVKSMVEGSAPPNAEELLDTQTKQLTLFYVVMPIVLLIILALSVWKP